MKKDELILSKVDGLPLRPSGEWVGRKYHYLKRYLDIFSVSMKKKWDLTYIDLFAGPGSCVMRESGEETAGSALISLQSDFNRYIFVEQNQANLEALKTRCARSPKFSQIEFLLGDCNDVVARIKWDGLALAFIDPTGIDFHFETVRKLAASGRVDLLMTVMEGMDIRRNLKIYTEQGEQSALAKFVGGSVPWSRIHSSRDVVVLFRKRLLDIGYKTAEFKDVLVRNVKNAPMYFLMFASKHPRGIDFWNKISAVDERGQQELF